MTVAVPRFLPRPWATLLHLASLAAVMALFLGRKPGAFRSETLVGLVPDVYLHVSNFAISYFLYAGAGYLWLVLGMSLRQLAAAGLVLAAANVVYEAFIPVLNTRDMIDAAYGVAGVAAGFAVLWLIQRRGLVRNPAAERHEA